MYFPFVVFFFLFFVLFVCSFDSVNLVQARHVWEEGLSVEELPLSDWPVDMPLMDIFLIKD